MTPLLQVHQLAHCYHAFRPTFHDIELDIAEGEIFCLLGPSGCGKSTLLQSIAGFEHPTQGDILFLGQSLLKLPPEKRGLGLVFQDYALFPHLTVEQNIGFALNDFSREKRAERISEMLSTISLAGYERKYPHELSGGEQQRVAIARSLANYPRLMLFDEPFSNLDPDRRQELRQVLRSLLKANNMTAIFVTHDQEEAFEISDRIAVMAQGRIHQVGTPQEIYTEPATEFVARFVGSQLFLKGTVTSLAQAHTPLGTLPLPTTRAIGEEVLFYLPYKALALEHPSHPKFGATVVNRRFKGEQWSYDLSCTELELEIKNFCLQERLEEGSQVFLSIDPQAIKKCF